MSIEAMKLALDALELEASGWFDVPAITRDAITTLRAAIEHAERPMTHSADCWRWHHACARAWIERNKHKSDGKEVLASTAPRQWQGLTDEEVKRCYFGSRADFMDYARAIEAKLKEKNHA